MARKKTVKDVEVEEKAKKVKKNEEEVAEEVIEEIDTRIDDEDDFEDEEETTEVEEKQKKKEKKEKVAKKQTKKDGYFAQVNKELKKVVWPKGGDIVKYSFAVIIFCLILCLFFVGIYLIASFVKGLFV